MSVQDRIKEYAVLQTIGVRPQNTFRLVLAESTILCVFGGVTGTLLALIALAVGSFAIGAEGATIAFRPSSNLFVVGAGVSFLVGILSGIAPAIQTATLPIVQALNRAY
jgi:putative ABC transport system permease protein